MANTYVNKVQLADGTSLIDISDTTATADKILSGYMAYGADGSKLTGTATGGGGSVTQDQDGFIVLPPDGGGSPSVGGLEYEEGTWIPTEDVARPTINFTDTHTNPPFYIMIADAEGDHSTTTYTNYTWSFICYYFFTGVDVPRSSTTGTYGNSSSVYRTNNSGDNGSSNIKLTSLDDSSSASSTAYYVSNEWFKPYTNADTRYWRAGRTYKWIAVWAPTT